MRGKRTKLRAFFWFLPGLDYKLSTLFGMYIPYLRKKGVLIGEGSWFAGIPTIDLTRPHLIEIGKNCVFSVDIAILTHGFDFCVLQKKYGDPLLGSSGKVVIEDNVFVGARSTILKNVRIGKNTIIGAGSVVTHDIPSNSVAAGNPCKVIMTIDQYYEKRKKCYPEEAKVYALEIFRKTGRVPCREDFLDEFPLFLDRCEKLNLLEQTQLGSTITEYWKTKPVYSMTEFLIAAGIPKEAIEQNKKL